MVRKPVRYIYVGPGAQDGCISVTSLEDFANVASFVISSIKLSVDPFSSRFRNDPVSIELYSRIVGDIEQLRFKFTAQTRRNRLSISNEHLIHAIIDLRNELNKLIENTEYVTVTSNSRFRMSTAIKSRSEIAARVDQRFHSNISALEATKILIENIENVANSREDITSPLTPELNFNSENVHSSAIKNLKAIVPQQKIAPVQFKIYNDKISIDRIESKTDRRDEKNTHIAKNEIIRNGEQIIEQLRKSNCDRRLLENVEYLHSQIVEENNAIQIGIGNISVGLMTQTFKNELPDAITSMLQSHNVAVSMYVAQFPDWNRFSENAALADITEEDISLVRKSSNDIVEYIESNADIAEPRVIRAFRQLSSLVENPSRASKRAAFAVIRSIENLISKIFHYTIHFVEQTASEVSKAGSKTVAAIIVALALQSAVSLISVSERINELTWLKNAIEIVQKQMKFTK